MNAGVLSGFTITNGYTRTSGNDAYERRGGGVNMYGGDGTVTNCTLVGNSANYNGGGSAAGTLNNCTLSGNSASWGGGASWGTLNNCTISGNNANAPMPYDLDGHARIFGGTVDMGAYEWRTKAANDFRTHA